MSDAGLIDAYKRDIRRQAGLNEGAYQRKLRDIDDDPEPMQIAELDNFLRSMTDGRH